MLQANIEQCIIFYGVLVLINLVILLFCELDDSGSKPIMMDGTDKYRLTSQICNGMCEMIYN